MHEAATTWALVVGINRYDAAEVRQLKGAVPDALAAVRFLRSLGVPDANVRVHLSPTDHADVAKEGISPRPATESAIWSSVNWLGQNRGTRLFVFLFGHGLYEPTNKRLFLTQEFGVDENWTNLSIDRYVDYFRSTRFERQFLIMDACSNLPYAQTVRTKIRAGYLGPQNVTPNPANSMLMCFACLPNEVAEEIDGHGLFAKKLFTGLDTNQPNRHGLHLDWTTGTLGVDLAKLMDRAVVIDVQADAASRERFQRPECVSVGVTRPEQNIAYRFPDGQTFALSINVQPVDAIGVDAVRIEVVQPPYWRLVHSTSAGNAVVPLTAILPAGTKAAVKPFLRTGWRASPDSQEVVADRDRPVTFALERIGVDPETTDWMPWRSGVRMQVAERYVLNFEQDGQVVEIPAQDNYLSAAKDLGFDQVPLAGETIATGIHIFPHETGPEFLITAKGRLGAEHLVEDWAAALRNATPSWIDVATSVELFEPPTAVNNLRLVLPRGGAAQLAGVLAKAPTVWIGPPDAPEDSEAERISLAQVEEQPLRAVSFDAVRVRVDLPWGSWHAVTRLSPFACTDVTLPATIGVAPLRVALRDELRRRPRLLGVGGRAVTGRIRAGLFGPSVPLASVPAGSAKWGLGLPSDVDGPCLVELGVRTRLCFPIVPGRAFGVDRSKRGFRVEPLSAVPRPEWDVLVTTGRPDALDTQGRWQLARGKWSDKLLGIAAAYALYLAGDEKRLPIVLRNLARLFPVDNPDLVLLQIAAKSDPELQLDTLAASGSVPLFRWGIPLALDLLAGLGELDKTLVRWRDALAQIADRLSPLSIWTAYTKEA
ncbi:MAG TPA: hypothetical protein VGM75_33495 [Pseudonocardiaceae bacterium]